MADCPVCTEECGTVAIPNTIVPSGSTCGDVALPISITEHVCDETDPTLPDNETVWEDIDDVSADTVTEGTVDGNGVFDLYMRAGMAQLNTQYDAGRIKGADFAAAYIEQMKLMMTEANKFVIAKTQADIAIRLAEGQYEGLYYDNENKKIQYAATEAIYHKTIEETAHVCSQIDLSKQQLVELGANGTQERSLKASQTAETCKKIDLLGVQISELSANGVQERSLKASQTTAQCKTVELYDRQIVGFDDKRDADAFSSIMQAWAIQGSEITTDQGASVLNTLKYGLMEEINNTGTGPEVPPVSTGGIIGKMLGQTKLNATGEPVEVP